MPFLMDSLEIRTVTQDDKDNVLEVYRQCEDFLALGPQPKASPEMVVKDMADMQHEGGLFRGIYADGKMVGVVSFIPGGFEGKPNTAFISLLMIAALYRKKGIGTEIVRRTEKEIMANSRITSILSGVQVNNPQALRFWEKNGYRIVGGPEARPDNTTVFHLRKECQPVVK
jgi:ribosomal protein S18 acetylase RimI-like enzyme